MLVDIENPSEDPFYLVRTEILGQLAKAETDLSKWTAQRDQCSDEFPWIHREFSAYVKELRSNIDELNGTIGIVERNPEKYPMAPTEISQRKTMIKELNKRMSSITGQLDHPQTKEAIRKIQQSKEVFRDPTLSNEFDEYKKQTNNLIRQEQDKSLHELLACSEQINKTAHVINNELEEQKRLMMELDKDIESQQSKLALVHREVGKLLKTSNMLQIKRIFGLFIICVALVFIDITIIFY